MMKPKNIVVTGGNSGVGYEAVKALYEEGHNVIFGSRNVAKNNEAITRITARTGGSVIAFPLDLSVRKSVEEFAKNVMGKFDHIDILVNNAGLILDGDRQTNEQGIEMTLAINHFGPFYLTYLLWGSLCKAPEARIINVSSEIHYRAPDNYLNDIECANKSFSGMTQYSISKLFNVLFTRGLNDLINKKGLKHVKTASLHPGVVDTNFG